MRSITLGPPMTMPALSIRQPWAWAICAGHKDVENRSWKTRHRGPFAIHAGSARPAASNVEWIRETLGISVPSSLTRGAIIGVANLVDIIDNSRSPWAAHGQLHWILADAELWATPIPCRGQLGLFHPP
jgi:ASCH domain